MRYENPARDTFRVDHREATTMPKQVKKQPTFPVTTIVLIPEMRHYLLDPCVTAVDPYTVIRWNSPELARKYGSKARRR